jgi:hypothetical protein
LEQAKGGREELAKLVEEKEDKEEESNSVPLFPITFLDTKGRLLYEREQEWRGDDQSEADWRGKNSIVHHESFSFLDKTPTNWKERCMEKHWSK